MTIKNTIKRTVCDCIIFNVLLMRHWCVTNWWHGAPPLPPTRNLCLHRCDRCVTRCLACSRSGWDFWDFRPKKPHTLTTAHSYYAMPLDNLYVRVRCSICAGSHLYKSGHYEPQDPTKWRHCPYCDDSGLQLIEATKDIVAQYVRENEELLKLITEKTPNKKSWLLIHDSAYWSKE